MPAIDRWVITHTLRAARGAACPIDVPVCSINLSGQSMSDESFLEFMLAELARSAVPCHRICFEITETAAIKSMEAAKQFMLRVKKLGCRFSLDDFGTGLSSFSYLKALPFDFVKIDGSFVKGILEDRVSESMVRAITEVGHAMGLGIIAEYVENAAIKDKLRAIGVDFVQGYAIEQPIPLGRALRTRLRAQAVNAMSAAMNASREPMRSRVGAVTYLTPKDSLADDKSVHGAAQGRRLVRSGRREPDRHRAHARANRDGRRARGARRPAGRAAAPSAVG